MHCKLTANTGGQSKLFDCNWQDGSGIRIIPAAQATSNRWRKYNEQIQIELTSLSSSLHSSSSLDSRASLGGGSSEQVLASSSGRLSHSGWSLILFDER